MTTQKRSSFDRARAAFGSLALVFAVVAGAAAPALAQQPVTRADSADVLVAAAERLQTQGSDELAEALARMVERRYADTPAAARARTLLASLDDVRASRSGRVGLVAFSTIYGAWLGVAVPLMLDAESPEAFGLGLLAGAPLGFFAGRAFVRDRSISGGDAGVVTWSTLWGTWQGFGWMLAVGDETEECGSDSCVQSEPDGSDIAGAMVAGGLIGIGASALAADRADIGGGAATMIGWGSLWGTGAGLVTYVLTDLAGNDDEPLIAALLGGDVGFASMALLAPDWNMSTGRAWLINAAGIMGGAVGGGIDLLLLPDDENIAVLIPTVGSAVGLWLGAHLTRDMDEGRVRDGRIETGDDSGALVRLRDGRWRVALPQPVPTLLRADAVREPELGARVQLLDARF